MSHFKYIIALCYAFAFSGFASAVDINAGTIRNQSDAQTKCPGVCSSKGYSWNGNWTTTDPGKMSVCGCEGATDVNAGPIWNNADAKTKCPSVCEGKGMQWNGQWTTAVQGEMSVCGCLLKSNQGA